MKTILMILLLLPTLTFAGPGVSTGDEVGVKYTCMQTGMMDSGYVATFRNVYGIKPKAFLSIGYSEFQIRTVDGICSRPDNVDEFVVNCVFVDGFQVYQALLHSHGTPELVSTVRRLNSDDPETTLECSITEM